jgi:thioredoxin-related protein
MKLYQLYVFTQDSCPPCARLKEYINTLSKAEQAELKVVPFKAPSGSLTALEESFQVEATPTLVVCHEDLVCALDDAGDEWCDGQESLVEKVVGANKIIKSLPSTLDAYTYAHPEE